MYASVTTSSTKNIVIFSIFALFLVFLLGMNEREETKATKSSASSSRLTDARIEKQVDSLLQLMTLEEKIGQLIQYTGYEELTGPGKKEGGTLDKYNRIKSGGVGSMLNVLSVRSTRQAQKLAVENSRLGIPMIFAYDVIHGYKTMFPIPLGETASWDMKAIKASARVAAREAAAAGLHWTFAPMVDISRDARWGRVMEGAGEDPFLGAQAAVARVKGFQADDLADPLSIAACAKHFAAYGFAEAGRDYNTADLSEHTLHNVVLPPFKACVEAGVATFMNSFNEIGGIPATANKFLQRDLLKQAWNFNGFIVSDWSSIPEMIHHGIADGMASATELAFAAGCDMDMEGYCYEKYLRELIEKGAIDQALLDDAVRRILRIKYLLGIMDDPYKYCDEAREQKEIYTKGNLAIARDVARKSIVLLKNEGQLLPLQENKKHIAVIGPLANDKDSPLGNWRGQAVANSAVSLLEGMQKAAGQHIQVSYAEGCKLSIGERNFAAELTINQSDKSLFPAAVALAKKADIVILALGEDSQQSGEGRSQVSIGLAGVQQELLETVLEANKNVIVVLMNGRPLEISWMADRVPAIVEAWHLGSEAGNAIADVLFGKYNPSGKLPMSFPRHLGQLPLYYSQKNTGRPGPKKEVFWSHYTDEKNDALYPFGFGLSYTTFHYGTINLSSKQMAMGGDITISTTLTNTGKYDGEEVVQLYVCDLVGSVTRPKKELKGFQKIFLKKGESKNIQFTLSSDDLAFYTRNKTWEAEPGKFKVFIGSSSTDTKEKTFELIHKNSTTKK